MYNLHLVLKLVSKSEYFNVKNSFFTRRLLSRPSLLARLGVPGNLYFWSLGVWKTPHTVSGLSSTYVRANIGGTKYSTVHSIQGLLETIILKVAQSYNFNCWMSPFTFISHVSQSLLNNKQLCINQTLYNTVIVIANTLHILQIAINEIF